MTIASKRLQLFDEYQDWQWKLSKKRGYHAQWIQPYLLRKYLGVKIWGYQMEIYRIFFFG